MSAKKVTKKAAPKTVTAKKAPAKKTVAQKAPAKKAVAKKAVSKKTAAKKAAQTPAKSKASTTIVVSYDVGMGNQLYLRGDGPGLSWVKGTIMENVDSETWKWSTTAAKSAFEVKFLINDETWSAGENCPVKPGTTTGFSPSF